MWRCEAANILIRDRKRFIQIFSCLAVNKNLLSFSVSNLRMKQFSNIKKIIDRSFTIGRLDYIQVWHCLFNFHNVYRLLLLKLKSIHLSFGGHWSAKLPKIVHRAHRIRTLPPSADTLFASTFTCNHTVGCISDGTKIYRCIFFETDWSTNDIWPRLRRSYSWHVLNNHPSSGQWQCLATATTSTTTSIKHTQ